MKNKTEQLNQLFYEWELKIPDYENAFVKDGIINEEFYSKAPVKVLFLTKETNNPNKDAGDFREWWKGKLNYTFSYRIGEWSYGLINDFPEYDEIWRKDDNAWKAIQSIALMNIKKSGGNGLSNFQTIIEHARRDFDFIHKEINIIDPEIIVLGVTWDEVRDALFPGVKWQESGYWVGIGRWNNTKLIHFYHPFIEKRTRRVL